MASGKVKAAIPALTKFHGALVGAVIGDCLGAHFECRWNVSPENVVKFFAAIDTKDDKDSLESSHPFTDDTAMARSVSASLIQHKGINLKDMAERFTTEFFKEPNRGYGGSVAAVFSKLADQKYAEVHGPAGKQFDGSGSYGNGGAMRIVPAALFGYQHNEDDLNTLVDGITKITHTHKDALIGSKLQCAAVWFALKEKYDPETPLDCQRFLAELQGWSSRLEESEVPVETSADKDSPAETDSPQAKRKAVENEEKQLNYSEKLKVIGEYLQQETDVDRKEIEETLGTDISALGSVPAAIYSFLRCTQPVSDIPRDVAFERTIIYAVSLGGDTDTIATMAGAIAGAYYGIESIPERWQRICEGTQEAKTFADSFHSFLNV